jgi:hypothetical protein
MNARRDILFICRARTATVKKAAVNIFYVPIDAAVNAAVK